MQELRTTPDSLSPDDKPIRIWFSVLRNGGRENIYIANELRAGDHSKLVQRAAFPDHCTMASTTQCRKLGLVFVSVALSISPTAFCEDSPPPEVRKQQRQGLAQVLSAELNGMAAMSRALRQLRGAHDEIANYQSVENPDAVLKQANAIEVDLIDRLADASIRITKNVEKAASILVGDEPTQNYSGVAEALAVIGNELKKTQEFLGFAENRKTRDIFRTHLEKVLDAWISAHPNADPKPVADLLVGNDPTQIDGVLQKEREYVAVLVEALSRMK